jgi:uncharacterized membrane protein YsdA (DUF1294 family)
MGFGSTDTGSAISSVMVSYTGSVIPAHPVQQIISTSNHTIFFIPYLPKGSNLMKLFLLYLLLMNAAAFVLMLVDKIKAVNSQWRIPESTLIGSAVLGGSAGALLGMYAFRHKTRHAKFTIGIPAILIVQIILAIWFFK